MTRNCVVCGREYEAQRPQAKYCGQTCRKRRQRSPEKTDFPVKKAAKTDSPASSGLIAAVESELRAAGRLETSLGQQAIRIAARMGEFETGGGLAALSRELRSIMADALRSSAEADPVDEMRARRDAKRAAAAAG